MHRARAARPRGFDSLPSKVLQEGTLPPFCSPMTLPRWAYEELVTAHHFIGVAPMHLVEQIRAPHDYQLAWVYAHLRPMCFVSLRVRVDGRGMDGFGGV